MKVMPLTEAHHPQWSELLAICFKRRPSDMLALLEWLQKMGRIVAWGAWDGDTLIAQYTSLLRQLYQDERNFLAGMSINMAVHPTYRGQGLIKQVSAPVYEEIEACGAVMGFGFSNADGVKVDKHSKSYGYRVLGKLQSLLTYLPQVDADVIRLSERFPGDIAFNYENPPRPKLHFDKSLSSLQIRYSEHPFRAYQYGIADDNGTSEGIVVYRDTRYFGVRGVSLMDAYGQNLPDLVRRWGSNLKRVGYHFVHTIATPQSSIGKSLHRAYQTLRIPYSRDPHYLTMRPISSRIDTSVFDFDNWDFIGGDIL